MPPEQQSETPFRVITDALMNDLPQTSVRIPVGTIHVAPSVSRPFEYAVQVNCLSLSGNKPIVLTGHLEIPAIGFGYLGMESFRASYAALINKFTEQYKSKTTL
jgi:hypothetical protein